MRSFVRCRIGPKEARNPGRSAHCGECTLLAAAYHGGRYRHALAIFGDGAPRNLDSLLPQEHFGDGIVGENLLCRLGFDELADTMTHGFGGVVRLARR